MTFLLGLLVVFDLITIELLVVITLVTGLADGLWTPTRLAIVPNLVPKSDMSSAIAFEATSFHTSQFVGPAIAGLIIAKLGVGFAFFANSILLAGVVVAFFFIKIIAIDRNGLRPSFIVQMKGAANYIKEQRGILVLLVFLFLSATCLRPYREFFAGFSDDIFARGAEGLSILASASGLGAVIAAIGVASFGRTLGFLRVVIISSALAFIFMLVFALSPTFIVAAIGSFGLGMTLTSLGISAQILLQYSVDDSMRGRVMSFWGLQVRAVPAIGGFIIGTAATAVSIRVALTAFAIVFALAAISYMRGNLIHIKRVEAALSQVNT
ncbi:MAG: hypothetical protein Hens3KO_13800 [Henriciella sp.]